MHAKGWAREYEAATEEFLDAVALITPDTLDLLVRLDGGNLPRYGEHAETGRYTLVTWLENYIQHPREHATELRAATNA